MKRITLKFLYVLYGWYRNSKREDNPYIAAVGVFLLLIILNLLTLIRGILNIEFISDYSKDDRWKFYVYGFPILILSTFLVFKFLPEKELLALEMSQEEHSRWKVGVIAYLIFFTCFFVFMVFYRAN